MLLKEKLGIHENREMVELFPKGPPEISGRTTALAPPDAAVPKHNTDVLAAGCLGKLEGVLAAF